jgi:hypothetical protein
MPVRAPIGSRLSASRISVLSIWPRQAAGIVTGETLGPRHALNDRAPSSYLATFLRTLFLCACLNAAAPLRAADSVALENTKPGTTLWKLTNPANMYGDNDLNSADYALAEIQGYASLTSVNQGGAIAFYVRTINTNPYTLSIFRMGWYNGLGGRLMLGPLTLPGVVQPMPSPPVYQPTGTGLVECNWSVSYNLTIPTDWVSGIYLVKLALSAPAAESYIVFVVRDDARNSPVLVQSSVATYQAYNEWGGSSLYSTAGGVKTGYKVSFNRPYWRNYGAGDFISLNGPPGYEMQLVRWLERNGYDATYVTDIDTHENPTLLLPHKVFLVVAHDEYWSRNMRDTVTRGRDAGVHLGFLGANLCYWQIRFEASSSGAVDRTIIGYKELAAMDPISDPRYVTTLWRNLEPEGALIGVQFNDFSAPTVSDMVVNNASHWLFSGTGVSNGSIFPNVVGYETDSLYPPAGATGLAHSPFPRSNPQVYGDMSIYTAPSGANVFATGTIEWSLGLDDFPPSQGIVPAVQQVTANFLSQALQNAPPLPPAVGSASPNSGAQGQNLPSVIISGSNFHNGATCSFGADITINSCAFNSTVQLTANITIPSSAAVGTRTISITNPDSQVGALINGFSVTAPSAAVISLSQKATFSQQPTSGGSVTFTLPQPTRAGHALIVGVSFWPLDISGVTDGSGDTFTRGLAASIFHNVGGSATYTNFYYAKSTAGGTNSLTLNFSGGTTYLFVAVAEVAGLDTSAPLDQSAFQESLAATTAWSSAAVSTTVANEYLFSWGATESGNPVCSAPASGWAIEGQTNDPSGATVCLLDRIVSATGSYQASVTTSAAQNYAMEVVTFKGGAAAPPPSVAAVNPSSGAQGQTLSNVLITGSSFQNGAACTFGAGISVNSCAFNSATQLTASITIGATAATGPRDVTVTNPAGQKATLASAFTVVTGGPPPAPTITAANPSSGAQGQNLSSVIISGTNFQASATCSFGTGITVNSCAFNTSTQLTTNISIGSTATTGTRDITATNPGGQSGILTNGFTVTAPAPPPPPTVNSLNPNSGTQGQTLSSVVIAGANFQTGATCSFAAGITVNSCAFNSGTQLTANIAITASAALGARNVTVTNSDGQSATLTNAFSVNAPSAISLVQKATFSRQPTSGGTVTFTLPQVTGAGHTLIVGMSFWPLDISSVKDGSGDTFTRGLSTSIHHNVSGSAIYTNFYYAKSTAGGANSLTLTFSGGNTYLLVAVAEVSGLDTSAPLDQSAFRESLTATAAWSSATVTTTAAKEYLFAWAASEAGNASCSGAGSGWTIESQTNDPAGATVCGMDRIVSASGSYQASVTASKVQNYAMEIVTFRGLP